MFLTITHLLQLVNMIPLTRRLLVQFFAPFTLDQVYFEDTDGEDTSDMSKTVKRKHNLIKSDIYICYLLCQQVGDSNLRTTVTMFSMNYVSANWYLICLLP